MTIIGFSDNPADDVAREGKFCRSLFGRKIEPAKDFSFPKHQRHTIVTGNPEEVPASSGGLCKRPGPGPILVFAKLVDIDAVLANIENPGGKTTLPKGGIEGVGFFAVITVTEGNANGLHQRPWGGTGKNFPAYISACKTCKAGRGRIMASRRSGGGLPGNGRKKNLPGYFREL
jgi:predicted enzyme related to lactoylglutathione lyase